MVEDETVTVLRGVPTTGSGPGSEADVAPGTWLGSYRVQGPLGHGGFATVYRGERDDGKQVAIKVLSRELSASPEMVARFVREVHAMRAIHSAHIAQFIEAGETADGRPFYAMEFLDGPNLRQYVAQRQRLSPEEVLELLTPVCEAIAATHAAGFVHRDIKASNVVVPTVDGRAVAKLVDFGIAKILYPVPGEPQLTALGERLGSASAMSPEQIRGEGVDGRSDIYSLGVLLFFMLTGSNPFLTKDERETQRMHLTLPAPAPSRWLPVPPEVDRVVLRCLEKDRALRYQTVAELLQALRAAVLLQGRGSSATTSLTQGVAIHVEAQVSAEALASMDDAVMMDIGTCLDEAERVLKGRGFTLLHLTPTSVLGVFAPVAEAELPVARAAVLLLATQLVAQVATREGADPRVAVAALAHCGPVELRLNPAVELVGGLLLRVDLWGPLPQEAGAWGTAAVSAGPLTRL